MQRSQFHSHNVQKLPLHERNSKLSQSQISSCTSRLRERNDKQLLLSKQRDKLVYARPSKEFLCLKALFFRNIYGILSDVPWCLANITKLSLTYASIGNATLEWDFAAQTILKLVMTSTGKARTLKLWVCPVLDVTVLNFYSRIVAVARMFGSLFKILIASSFVWQCVRNSVYVLERLIAHQKNLVAH